ncbi:MAG: hypothetical protein ACI9CD_001207 [Candidatus Deianiraeaceae bacterium]|jgi:hypothetical protein
MTLECSDIPILSTIVGAIIGLIGSFIMPLLPLWFINKRDKIEKSISISNSLNAQFKIYKKTLENFILTNKDQQDTSDFRQITDEFEELIGNLSNACELLIEKCLTKSAKKKFLPIIREVCDFSMIKTYYSIVKMEYKKENYALIFEVYESQKYWV